MIIVSQGKEVIVNFDITEDIWISKHLKNDEVKFEIFEIRAGNCSNSLSIGRYKTEERAKEVLEEIVQKYSSYLELKGGPAILQGQMDIQPNIFNIPKVYEMPKE